MHAQYASRHVDLEWLPPTADKPIPFVAPKPIANRQSPIANPPGWPFDAPQAKQKQADAGFPATLELPLGHGQKLELVLVPAGEFVMGDAKAGEDEARVRIEKPFYLSRCELSNEQYRTFDPAHKSGLIGHMSFNRAGDGFNVDGPKQPVARVSWQRAMAFCEALNAKTGRRVTLPTEAQWEWACRAGSATTMWYGDTDTDFSKFENLADRTLRKLAAARMPKWFLRDDRVDDRGLVTVAVGSYRPNPWGLHDMHGNVCEWTRSAHQSAGDEKVVRGGSRAPPRTLGHPLEVPILAEGL